MHTSNLFACIHASLHILAKSCQKTKCLHPPCCCSNNDDSSFVIYPFQQIKDHGRIRRRQCCCPWIPCPGARGDEFVQGKHGDHPWAPSISEEPCLRCCQRHPCCWTTADTVAGTTVDPPGETVVPNSGNRQVVPIDSARLAATYPWGVPPHLAASLTSGGAFFPHSVLTTVAGNSGFPWVLPDFHTTPIIAADPEDNHSSPTKF